MAVVRPVTMIGFVKAVFVSGVAAPGVNDIQVAV